MGVTGITVIVVIERQKRMGRGSIRQIFSPSSGAGGAFYITGSLGRELFVPGRYCPRKRGRRPEDILMVSSNTLGHGDDELGKRLMVNFIRLQKRWMILADSLFEQRR
jgi:hypothetical protein